MPAAVQTFQTLQQLQAQLSLAVKLRYCCRAGLDINVSDQFDSNDGEKEADRLEDITQKAILQTTAALETYQNAATTRLGSALQLLHTAACLQQNSKQRTRLRCAAINWCSVSLLYEIQIETVIPLTHMHGVLGLLIERLPEDDNTDSYFAAIRGITRYLTPTVQLLRNAWSRIPYPYNSHDDELTLGKYLIPDPPVGDQASVIFGCCDQAVNSTFPLYLRVLGDLTLIAESVEKSLGLEPLPEMPLMEPDAAEMTTGT